MTTTLHSDVFEFLRRESWNCSEDYDEFTHDQKPYKKQSGHISPPSPGEMLLNSFLKETQKQKKNRRKTEFIQKIKDIFGFSFKESSTAKPRRLKVTQKTENTQLLSRKSNTTE